MCYLRGCYHVGTPCVAVAILHVVIPHVAHSKLHNICMFYATRKHDPCKHVMDMWWSSFLVALRVDTQVIIEQYHMYVCMYIAHMYIQYYFTLAWQSLKFWMLKTYHTYSWDKSYESQVLNHLCLRLLDNKSDNPLFTPINYFPKEHTYARNSFCLPAYTLPFTYNQGIAILSVSIAINLQKCVEFSHNCDSNTCSEFINSRILR